MPSNLYIMITINNILNIPRIMGIAPDLLNKGPVTWILQNCNSLHCNTWAILPTLIKKKKSLPNDPEMQI